MRFLIVLASLNVIMWGGMAAVFGELVRRAEELTGTPSRFNYLMVALPAVVAVLMVYGCWLVKKREPAFTRLWAVTVLLLISTLIAFFPTMAVLSGGV